MFTVYTQQTTVNAVVCPTHVDHSTQLPPHVMHVCGSHAFAGVSTAIINGEMSTQDVRPVTAFIKTLLAQQNNLYHTHISCRCQFSPHVAAIGIHSPTFGTLPVVIYCEMCS